MVYADLEHKEVWQSFIVLAILLLAFNIYAFTNEGTDRDSVDARYRQSIAMTPYTKTTMRKKSVSDWVLALSRWGIGRQPWGYRGMMAGRALSLRALVFVLAGISICP